MKVYRVEYKDSGSESRGFDFFSSAEAASKCRRNWTKEDEGNEAIVDCIEFDCTKVGVLKLLHKVASHPDNG